MSPYFEMAAQTARAEASRIQARDYWTEECQHLHRAVLDAIQGGREVSAARLARMLVRARLTEHQR